MTAAGTTVLTVVGLALVLVALTDLFRTLWRPSGVGHVTRPVMRATWRVTRRLARRRSSLDVAGPLGLALVLLSWALLTVAGFTLVYWPHVPGGVVLSDGLAAAERSNALDALYLSLVTEVTLGYGDVVPQNTWLRVAAPLQAFVGFVILTGAVTWTLQVYPALGRRRMLALRLSRLADVGATARLAAMDDSTAVAVLEPVVDDLTRVRVDVDQYNVSYWFSDADRDASLAVRSSVLLDLAEAATACPGAGTRTLGDSLRRESDDLASALQDHDLVRDVPGAPHASSRAVFAAWAADHSGRGA